MKNIKNWEQFNEDKDEDWSDEENEWREDAARDRAYLNRTIENNPDDITCDKCGFIGDIDDYEELTEEDKENDDYDDSYNYVKCPDCGKLIDL